MSNVIGAVVTGNRGVVGREAGCDGWGGELDWLVNCIRNNNII